MVNTKDKYDIIEGFIIEFLKKFKEVNWLNNNAFEITKDKKIIGKVTLNDTEIISKGKEIEAFHNILIKRTEEAEKLNITEEKTKKSVFKKLFSNLDLYNGLKDNHIIFKLLDKEFKKIGIDEVVSGNTYTDGMSVKNKLTLGFSISPGDNSAKDCPSGFFSRLKNILWDKYPNDADSKTDFTTVWESKLFKEFEGEKIEEIKIGDMVIGNYLKERNLIHLFINPFKFKKILPLEDKLHPFFNDLIKALKSSNIKTINTEPLSEKMFISAFMSNTRTRQTQIKKNIDTVKTSIDTFEKDIRDSYRKITNLHAEIGFIESTLKSGGKNLFLEIKKAKVLTFVKNIKIDKDKIRIRFIPTCLKIPDYYRTAGTTHFGRRMIYLGELLFTIGPSSFTVDSDISIVGSPHPHVTGQGSSPCFGDGSSRKMVYELLAQNKFAEVCKMLWFWTKIFRNNGAYHHQNEIYDSTLKQGIPMWDDKGKRIELNDKDRIKSGEQSKIDKADNYETNIKAYKDVKLC